MKVLILHNEYQQPGGEDTVVNNESKLLQGAGHLVYLEIFSNHNIKGPVSKILAAVGMVFSLTSFFRVKKMIKKIKPDVVHVHNFFPLLSPSVFYACKSLKIPVVLTLHNYRTLCPTAVLMYEGHVCERSLKNGPWWAIKKKAYRNSLIATFFLTLMIDFHKKFGTWSNAVDRFIVLSESSKQKFISAGFPSNKIIKKPNFVDISYRERNSNFQFLYVGRLSEEKGVNVIKGALNFLSESVKISLIGDGPLKSDFQKNEKIDLKGRLNSNQVFDEMNKHYALLLPSICLETFGMTVIEAYANGLPVIASRIGALEELVEHQVTGLLFEAGNPESLTQAMLWALDHPQEMYQMGLNARKKYEQSYTAQKNLQQLEDIYMDAIQSCNYERPN
ncbi:glycosyltransferase family 4 protein [Acinetobacter sp. YH16050]|uniref:glycosyltransferase family 4 protein n=1 Tax=Acinetobacter sp. YH16050 TaxID=2601189 RepID=UPI0015D10C03|nr:glycosyltransferase family 4 protein [Acinetobacter sp. YH16050]